MDTVREERVGLLFVHGMGEQRRFEHLRNSVKEVAELLIAAEPKLSVTVTDRTDNWSRAPGDPTVAGDAPITLATRDADGNVRHFGCHEVWWADLGKRVSLGETISFWFWGLGQWAAPIYRALDASRMRDAATNQGAARTVLPLSASESFWLELKVRFHLWLAALAAICTLFSWSLGKWVFAKLTGSLPGPSLIAQYVGDVQIYEQRAVPNMSALSDPGQPLRVGIRRRMVTEMVAMAGRPYDRWYIVAHSLGTVVAYNGMTELGHTLPNYLPESLWRALPDRLKRQDRTKRRPDEQIANMMPARPSWLEKDSVIDRAQLFAKLRGILTYGSPLNKFGAIWPRIVATADDQADGKGPFPETCEWLNVAAPHDPVSGRLREHLVEGNGIKTLLPKKMADFSLTWRGLPLLAHIRYFVSAERFSEATTYIQRKQIVQWLTDGSKTMPRNEDNQGARVFAFAAYLIIIAALATIACFIVTSAVVLAVSILSKQKFEWAKVFEHPLSAASLAIGIALALVTLAGLIRWPREARLSQRLADVDVDQRLKKHWRMLTVLGFALAAIAVPLLAYCLARDLAHALDLRWWAEWETHLPSALTGAKTTFIALLLFLMGWLLQCSYNAYAKGKTK